MNTRLARAVARLLGRLEGGATLVRTIALEPGAGGGTGGVAFVLEPGGRPVDAAIAEAAVVSGEQLPGNDGLFGPETSQTWRARSGARSEAAR